MDTQPKVTNLPPAAAFYHEGLVPNGLCPPGLPPRLASQGSLMATEGVSVRAGHALGLPNVQGKDNDGHSHHYNPGKDQLISAETTLQELWGSHIPWQIDPFLSVASENGTEMKINSWPHALKDLCISEFSIG